MDCQLNNNLFRDLSRLKYTYIRSKKKTLHVRAFPLVQHSELWNLWPFAMTDVNLCSPILGLK